MVYVYRCGSCGYEMEVKEKFSSDPSHPECLAEVENGYCHGSMARKPQLFTGLFKFSGATRVSTNDLSPNQRKLSPWFGGSTKNAPDYEEIEYRRKTEPQPEIVTDFSGKKHV